MSNVDSGRPIEEESLFANVVSPLSVRQFVHSYWEVRPLHIRGNPERLAGLTLGREEFTIAVENTPAGYLKAASAASKTDRSTYRIIDGKEAIGCFASGMTLCITGIDRNVPVLKALSLDTKRALQLAGNVHCNCYMSPQGEGFGVHFDTQSIFLLQTEGSKRWWYGKRPATPFPPEAADGFPLERLAEYREKYPTAEVVAPQDSEWSECTLTPGDTLYLPPGTWHRGRAEDHSLAVTLTCGTLDFSALLHAILETQIFQTLPWRQNLPVCLEAESSAGAPITKENFSESRLNELKEIIESLGPSDFVAVWQRMIQEQNEL